MKTFPTVKSPRCYSIYSLEGFTILLFTFRSHFKVVTPISVSGLMKQSKLSPVSEAPDPWEVGGRSDQDLALPLSWTALSRFCCVITNIQILASKASAYFSLTFHISCGSGFLWAVGDGPSAPHGTRLKEQSLSGCCGLVSWLRGQNKRDGGNVQWH